MLRSAFIPGIELSRRFFHELVEPLIAELYPALEYGAALVGSGSEVLGFDDEVSSDHHWGPRLQLFLNERDLAIYGREIRERMSLRLPTMFHGYSTNFTPPDPEDGGTQLLDLVESGPVNHRVETLSLRGYCLKQLGIRPDSALSPVDWLTIPGQKLAAMTAGAVYRDDLGELTRLRHKLAYYPHDVWLYMLAAGWTRIGQEEAFVGRAGSVEGELGSRIIASRIVHDLMNLCFLFERRYPPYSKWFGTAFNSLESAKRLTPILQAVLDAAGWREREKHLTAAYQVVARKFNRLSVCDALPEDATEFHGRGFMVIHGERFADAIRKQIRDPELRRIASLTSIGSVEQFSSSTDVLSDSNICRKLRTVYS